jgi:hypothetical protein
MRYVLIATLLGCAAGGPGDWTPDAGDSAEDGATCLSDGTTCVAVRNLFCCGDSVCRDGRCVSP